MTTVTDTSAEGPAHQISYGYDYRGVRISRTETPTDAGSANRYYFYTPELQLLSSTVDDSNNVWGQSAHIMAAPLTMNREVIWFAGQPVAEYGPPRTPDSVTPLSAHHTSDTNTPANNLFYTFTDHLGTPLLQTDPTTTTIVWRAEHEPYGNVYLMRKGSRTDQPLRLPGQEAAMTWEGAEENYNVFRWYRAGWGRYTQADPIGLGGGLTLYGYVHDNPPDDSDSLGLFDGGAFVKKITQQAINTCEEDAPGLGGPIGGAFLSLISAQDLNPEDFENQIKKCKSCKSDKKQCAPCQPPLGSVAYQIHTGHKHSPYGDPHYKLFEMHQSPPSAGCKCFWKPIGYGNPPPPAGTIPFPGPAGGGGFL